MHTSLLYIHTNCMTDEKIACGVLLTTNDKSLFKWSKEKLKIASSLCEPGYNIEYFQNYISSLDVNAHNNEERVKSNAGPIQFGPLNPCIGILSLEQEIDIAFNRSVLNKTHYDPK
jgi:hypothetical protein